MEVYYKDLISEEASLEKLVDDLLQVVQGADEFAQAASAHLPGEHKQELATRLERLKEGCQRIREHVVESAVQTDKVLRRNPYSMAAVAFALGALAGVLACRQGWLGGKRKTSSDEAED
jgi:ElaB/YqjD/DUF883 family membrane-anchored ribosome-binding protein